MKAHPSKAFGLLRIAIGWLFLWAALDKIFGLGYATKVGWVDGVSPTTGFLKSATEGPLVDVFQALSGSPIVDFLFVGGLLAAGACLILGIFHKLACWGGALIMALIYLSIFPPENNPVIDEHIIYILSLIGLSQTKTNQLYGLGEWWSKTPIVRAYPILA